MGFKIQFQATSQAFQPGAIRERLAEATGRAAAEIEARAKNKIRDTNKTGRLYRVGSIRKAYGARHTGQLEAMGLRGRTLDTGKKQFVIAAKVHRASARGEAPALFTGNLANSIKHTEAEQTALGVRSTVNVNARYGKPLETKLDRPYLTVAAKEVAEDFTNDCRAIVKDMI